MSNVVKQYEVNKQEGSFLIETRKAGLIQLLLTYLKLSPSTTLSMKNSLLEFRSTNWLGYEAVRVPAEKVTGVICGLRRNWIYLVLALALCWTIVGLVVGIWCFFKLKEFFIGFENGGDHAWVISFGTKNLLEGKEISTESLEGVSEMIKDAMIAK
ncbi:MAG: hypothetical protein ACI4P3_01655 [Candidatus Spyradosoma sp.]